MKLHELIAEWLTVRRNELRAVALSFVNASSVMGFLVLARSMREGIYLNTFDVRTLPYIEKAFEVLSVPTAVVFGWLLARHAPEKILLAVASVVAGGLSLSGPSCRVPRQCSTQRRRSSASTCGPRWGPSS